MLHTNSVRDHFDEHDMKPGKCTTVLPGQCFM